MDQEVVMLVRDNPKLSADGDLHYPLTWSNGFCGRRGKRGALVERKKTRAHGREILR